MRKPKLLKAAGVALVSLLALQSGAAYGMTRPDHAKSARAAMPQVTIKLSCPCSSAPPMAPQTQELYRIAKVMKVLTHGAVNVEIFPNSSLVPAAQELEALQNNTIQMAETSGDEYQSLVGAGMIYEIPYLFTTFKQELQTFASKPGQHLVNLIDKTLGVHMLGILDLGQRELDLATTKHISTPADLKGIKLRMPPGPYWALLGQALGGNVTPVAFTEIYLSLQTGVIQAQDNPLPTDIADKFYEVTKQIVLTNHVIEPLMPVINEVTWNQMSPAEQADLQKTVTQQDAWESNQVQSQQQSDITFLRHHGLKVYSPNIASFRKPALKAFLCNPTYIQPLLKEAHGLLNYALKLSGAVRPAC
jgi:tripartite ATP-independent transporter DctP family solute receptor